MSGFHQISERYLPLEFHEQSEKKNPSFTTWIYRFLFEIN